MKKILTLVLISLATMDFARADERGPSVVVIYNSASKDSKDIAQHYADLRSVPKEQVLGLKLPETETFSRVDFRKKLQEPLIKFLTAQKLFTFDDTKKLTQSKIRYAVLCYGVPLRIAEDTSLSEPDTGKLQPELRRNGAAVDSELALLPFFYQKIPLTGPLRNLTYPATNSTALNPLNGVLMVTRLDGPTPALARSLVDKAIEAEKNGLWGRAYFDLRGLTNGGYLEGEQWIREAAEATQRYGFETVIDTNEATFSTNFPMSQIALYAGWYDTHVSGPFTQTPVEFMPGAIAYHLHSTSAASLRSTNQNWCGPFLNLGVTATLGCIDEPLLGGTPNVGQLFVALIHGFTFGEAAYSAQPLLSWQTTVVGDPLYTPFQNQPRQLHEKLAREKNPLIEWSHLRIVNITLAMGAPLKETIQYLEAEPATFLSPVLSEKLGDLYQAEKNPAAAQKSWRLALTLNPSRQQRVRLEQDLAH